MVWRVVRSKKVVDLLDMRTREMIKKLELVRFAHNWPALARQKLDNASERKTRSGPGNVGILANIPIFLV